MEVVPVNFGLKYKPPKLGIQYYINSDPNVQLIHEIPLAFVQKQSNVETITNDLFEKHKQFLNPKVVSSNQI